jgi:hypothetical protein
MREFSDLGRFQTNSEKSWIDEKRGQIVFARFYGHLIDDERG